MTLYYSHGRVFVNEVLPLVETRDMDAVSRHLANRWPADTLRRLLVSGHDDAVKLALFSLSLIGKMEDNAAIAPLLRNDDAFVASLAERAMWSTWFRASDEQANIALQRAVRLIGTDQFDKATEVLSELLACRPDFAEAHNQLAIVHFLRGDCRRAEQGCRCTLQLNPYHFGAMAGLGHCLVAQGRLDQALITYRCLLRLHPQAEGIREAVRQLSQAAEPSYIPDGPWFAAGI